MLWLRAPPAPQPPFSKGLLLYVDSVPNDSAEDTPGHTADDPTLHLVAARARAEDRTGRRADRRVTLGVTDRLARRRRIVRPRRTAAAPRRGARRRPVHRCRAVHRRL